MRMTETHREAVPAPMNHLLSAARDSEEVEDLQVAHVNHYNNQWKASFKTNVFLYSLLIGLI